MTTAGEGPLISQLGGPARAIHPYIADALVILPRTPVRSATETCGTEPHSCSGWIPLATLVANPDLLAAVIEERVESRAASNPDVAAASPKVRSAAVASALFQTLAWRALGPAIALGVIAGARESGAPGGWVQFDSDGAIRFGHEDVRLDLDHRVPGERRPATPAISDESLHALRTGPWSGFLLPLADAFRTIVRFGPRQLPGNAASPIASIVRLLVAKGHLQPADGEPIHRRITNALDLSTYGVWHTQLGEQHAAPAPVWYQRSTCCLWYRVGSGTCGDCSLKTDDELSRSAKDWWTKSAPVVG